MRAIEETNLIVDVELRGGGAYLDIIYNGKRQTRKVNSTQYWNGLVWSKKQKCIMVDDLTGHQVESQNCKSVNGSYKHAAEDLVRKLIANRNIV